MNTTTVATDNQNQYDEDTTTDKLMARILHELCEKHGLTRDDIRAGLSKLTDDEFNDLWNGDRCVYVSDAANISRVFGDARIYQGAIFDALREARN